MGITALYVRLQGLLALFRHSRLFVTLFAWAGLFLAIVPTP
jgi:hypothetical protein